MAANAFGVDHGDSISKGIPAQPLKLLKTGFKATKVGVVAGKGSPTQRAATHTGIALGHATTAGGALGAAGAAGAAYGVGRNQGKKSVLGKKYVVEVASKEERKAVRRSPGYWGGAAVGSAGAGYLGAVHGAKRAIENSGHTATKVGKVPLALGAAAAVGGGLYSGHAAHKAQNKVRMAEGKTPRNAFGLVKKPKKAEVAKSWQEIAKAEWKTIEQRQHAQRQNRKHAAGAQIAGTYAALGGGYAAIRGGATTRQFERSANDASSAFTARREMNALSTFPTKGVTSIKVKGGSTPGDFARGTKAFFRGAGKGRMRAATGAMAGGVALATGASAAAGSRNKYHQHKINERRRSAHLKRVTSDNDD